VRELDGGDVAFCAVTMDNGDMITRNFSGADVLEAHLFAVVYDNVDQEVRI